MVAAMDPVPGVTTPSIAESAEPMMELVSTPQQLEVSSISVTSKGKGTYVASLKKKTVPPTKSKGVLIDILAVLASFMYEEEEEEEEEPILRGYDIIPLPANVPVEQLSKEEAFTIKTSRDTAFEERAARATSFICDRALSSLPISFSLYCFLFLY